RLSVFAGGSSLEAAEAVCDATLDGLESLIEKNLLRQEEGLGGEPRFTMLETIREYAAERLEERPDADEERRTHPDYFARRVHTAKSVAARRPSAHRRLRERRAGARERAGGPGIRAGVGRGRRGAPSVRRRVDALARARPLRPRPQPSSGRARACRRRARRAP